MAESYLCLNGDLKYANPMNYVTCNRMLTMGSFPSSAYNDVVDSGHMTLSGESDGRRSRSCSADELPRKRLAIFPRHVEIAHSPQRTEDDTVLDEYSLAPSHFHDGNSTSASMESMLESIWALIEPGDDDNSSLASPRTGSQLANSIISSAASNQAIPVAPASHLCSSMFQCMQTMLQMFPYDCMDVWAPVQVNEKTLLTMGACAFKESRFQEWTKYSLQFAFEVAAGVPGRVFTTHCPECIPDLQQTQVTMFHRLEGAMTSGIRSTLALPVHALDGTVVVFMLYSQHAFLPEEGLQTSILEFLKCWSFDAHASMKCSDTLNESHDIEEL